MFLHIYKYIHVNYVYFSQCDPNLLVSKPVNDKFSAMHEYDNLYDSISLLHFTCVSICILSAKDQVITPT